MRLTQKRENKSTSVTPKNDLWYVIMELLGFINHNILSHRRLARTRNPYE